LLIFALFGAAVGSFLNVCIDRLPAGRSLLFPPSHCDVCQHPLAPRDLIPIFSYLWLRRRCRYCQALIPWRPLWVEIASGGLLALTYWHFGLSTQFATTALYGWLFIVIGVIDLEHQLILNKIVFPAAAFALVTSIMVPPSGILYFSLPWPWAGLVSGVMGAATGFIFLLIPFILSLIVYRQEGMGFGDVKMAGLIGLVTGFPLVLLALLSGAILGGLVASVLLLLRVKSRKEAIPFGPFLSLTTIATLLWGNDFLSWYLGLFQF